MGMDAALPDGISLRPCARELLLVSDASRHWYAARERIRLDMQLCIIHNRTVAYLEVVLVAAAAPCLQLEVAAVAVEAQEHSCYCWLAVHSHSFDSGRLVQQHDSFELVVHCSHNRAMQLEPAEADAVAALLDSAFAVDIDVGKYFEEAGWNCHYIPLPGDALLLLLDRKLLLLLPVSLSKKARRQQQQVTSSTIADAGLSSTATWYPLSVPTPLYFRCNILSFQRPTVLL